MVMAISLKRQLLVHRKGGVLYGVVAHAAALRTAVPWAVLVQLPFLFAFSAVWGGLTTLIWFGCVVRYIY